MVSTLNQYRETSVKKIALCLKYFEINNFVLYLKIFCQQIFLCC